MPDVDVIFVLEHHRKLTACGKQANRHQNKYGGSTATTSWPNIYLKGNYYDSNIVTNLSYQVIAYHLTNNEEAEYDNVNLISNHKKFNIIEDSKSIESIHKKIITKINALI